MKIKVKLLDSERYKDSDSFEAAIDRWEQKGWKCAEVAQDIINHGEDAVAILWRPLAK